MGYNTGLLFLNDAAHLMRENPKQFVEDFYLRMAGAMKGTFSVGNHANAATIFHCAHADFHKGYLIGGNTTLELPGAEAHRTRWFERDQMNEEILRSMADEMGYRLVKLPTKTKVRGAKS